MVAHGPDKCWKDIWGRREWRPWPNLWYRVSTSNWESNVWEVGGEEEGKGCTLVPLCGVDDRSWFCGCRCGHHHFESDRTELESEQHEQISHPLDGNQNASCQAVCFGVVGRSL